MEDTEPTSKIRFSLSGLLGVTTVVAIALAPVGWLGPNYAWSAAASLVLLASVCWALVFRKTGLAVAACIPAALLAVPLFSSGLFFHAVGTALVCLTSMMVADRVRWRLGACLAVMLLAYLPAFRYAIDSDRRINAMRREWPMVSIRDRLPAQTDLVEVEPVSLSTSQMEALDQLDTEAGRSWGFARTLARIHSDSYMRFARAPGFGMMRMGPVTLHQLAKLDDDRQTLANDQLPRRLHSRANTATASELHIATQAAFLINDRIGYAESPDRVAGFLGHGFIHAPYNQRWRDEEEVDDGDWTIDRLELIGLVVHDNPVAYVSDKLPNMEDLHERSTRTLEPFEADALTSLRGEEDLVITEDKRVEGDRHVRMVGAIRAGASCATCHEVPIGTLLGAFSYDLTKLNPAQSRPSAGG